MQLNIKNDKTYELASSLSKITGESLTQAVTTAIAERLERAKKLNRQKRKGLAGKLKKLSNQCQELPLLDDREHGDILYDENGLPRARV